MIGRCNLASLFLFKGKKLLILSWLNDFMTCSVHFNIQSEGSISHLWDTVRG